MIEHNKIFGIGEAKTGTSSLGVALKMLGFNHKFYNFELSNRVWKSGDYETVFREAEKYDSFEDGPWNRGDFYKQLDRRFPNSRFILTVREMQSWVKSHEKHFSKDGLRQIPKELWKPSYDEPRKNQLIQLHKQRIEEIKTHFKDRPEDLLIINICDGEGWEKLCPFLGLPIKNEPFPVKNVTSDKERAKQLEQKQNVDKLKRTFKRIFQKLVKK